MLRTTIMGWIMFALLILQRCIDARVTDPGLLRKHSSLRSCTTSFGTYPTIRVFKREHPQADKLPSKPTPLPLLVFVHGYVV